MNKSGWRTFQFLKSPQRATTLMLIEHQHTRWPLSVPKGES